MNLLCSCCSPALRVILTWSWRYPDFRTSGISFHFDFTSWHFVTLRTFLQLCLVWVALVSFLLWVLVFTVASESNCFWIASSWVTLRTILLFSTDRNWVAFISFLLCALGIFWLSGLRFAFDLFHCSLLAADGAFGLTRKFLSSNSAGYRCTHPQNERNGGQGVSPYRDFSNSLFRYRRKDFCWTVIVCNGSCSYSVTADSV